MNWDYALNIVWLIHWLSVLKDIRTETMEEKDKNALIVSPTIMVLNDRIVFVWTERSEPKMFKNHATRVEK